MQKFILLILVIITVFSCTEKEIEPVIEQPIRTVAIIGDQITIGESLENPETEGFPAKLETLLGERYILKTFAIEDATILRKGNRPILKDTTIYDAIRYFEPDITVINLGTNDTKIRNWWRHGDEFTNDYQEFIDTIIQLTDSSRIMVCRPTRIFDNYKTINDSCMQVGVLPAIDSVIVWKRVEVIDLHRILEHRGNLFSKGVFPKPLANRIIAELIADAIK